MEFIEPVRLQSRADDAQLIDGVIGPGWSRSLFTARSRTRTMRRIAKEARALAEAPTPGPERHDQVEGRGQLNALKGQAGAGLSRSTSSGANGRETVRRAAHRLGDQAHGGYRGGDIWKVARRIRRLPWQHLKDHTWVGRARGCMSTASPAAWADPALHRPRGLGF